MQDLITRTERRIDSVAADLRRREETPSEALELVADIVQEIARLVADFEDTFRDIEQLDPGGELAAAVRETESCRELRARGG